jgi:hypothetical protein
VHGHGPIKWKYRNAYAQDKPGCHDITKYQRKPEGMPCNVKSDIKISPQQNGEIQGRKEKQKRLILYEKSVAKYDKADHETERTEQEYLSKSLLSLNESEDCGKHAKEEGRKPGKTNGEGNEYNRRRKQDRLSRLFCAHR